MNKTILLSTAATFLLAATGLMAQESKQQPKQQQAELINPFYSDFNTPYRTVAFDKINIEDYLPAIKLGIKIEEQEIDAIVKNPASPTFENTITAMQRSGEMLSRATSVFYNLLSAETSPDLQSLAKEISPILSTHGSNIRFNKALFERIDYVYQNRAKEKLTPEQIIVLEKTWKAYAQGGAKLSAADQDKLRAIDMEASKISIAYSENILNETNSFSLNITDVSKLKGLPKSALDAAAAEAKSRKQQGYTFTLDEPSYGPVMKYAEDRELRKKLYMAYNSRAAKSNQYNNFDNINRIVELKEARAKLLGYDSYATIALEDRMAKNAETVNVFLADLLSKALPAAKADVQMLKDFAKKNDGIKDLQSWDHTYYANKLKEAEYSFNDELLKPYFKLENVIEGAFYVANKLYGLTFERVYDIPTYHPDVQTYVVRDSEGKFKAIFYGDYFPREGKRAGAWMNNLKDQNKLFGDNQAPHIINVCNFTKPTEDAPSLLTFYEVTVLFHEFGHALHGILSDVTYPMLSGTSVPRDFVELPSHIMENWAKEPEVLKVFAKHYQTGEVIPQEYLDALKRSLSFMEGYATVRQLSFGILDMAWHSKAKDYLASKKKDLVKFERTALLPTQLYPFIDGAALSSSFAHIFSGGYAAGYYSYKWAETHDADAFEYFKQTGILSRETGKKFEAEILSKGGTVPADQMYINFRGRKADPQALLRRAGLVKK